MHYGSLTKYDLDHSEAKVSGLKLTEMAHSELVTLIKGQTASRETPSGIDTALWRELCGRGRYRTVPLRHILIDQGESLTAVWIITNGLLSISKGDVIMDLAISGDSIAGALFTGSTAGSHNIPSPISVQAVIRSEVLEITIDAFQELLTQSIELRNIIQKNFQKRMMFIQNCRASSMLSAQGRLAQFLLAKKELIKNTPLTRRLMGKIVGTTTETVIRTLSIWEKAGWIIKTDRGLEIIHQKELEGLCSVKTE